MYRHMGPLVKNSRGLISPLATFAILTVCARIHPLYRIGRHLMPNNQTDTASRFLFEGLDIRGEIVRLSKSYQAIMQQHGYPSTIQRLLGEALLAAVLLRATIKLKGQLTIQFQSDGPVELLVAKCDDQYHIRGVARWKPDAISDEMVAAFGEGQLVITIAQAKSDKIYQSIVVLEGKNIATALKHYFSQSEQLATHFVFHTTATKAVGILLQVLPSNQTPHHNIFAKQASQLAHLSTDVILNSDNQTLLKTAFPEHNIRLFDPADINFQCTCSIEGMQKAIVTMGEPEIRDILHKHKEVVVTCEYCNHEYAFSEGEITDIFNEHQK